MLPAFCRITLRLLILAPTLCWGQEQNRDVVTLVNNDRLTGEIVKGNQGSLLLDSDLAGMVSLDVEDVLRAEAGNASRFLFLFKDNSIMMGRFIMSNRDAFSVVTVPGDTLNFRMSELIRFSRYESEWYKRIDGHAGLGYSFTKASGLGRLNVNYSLAYALKRWTFTHTLSGIYSSEAGGLERLETDFSAVFNITSRWALVDYLKYQKNMQLNLRSRALNLVAIGHHFIVHKNVELLAASGISFQRESASAGEVATAEHTELPVLVRFSLFDLDKPNIDFSTTNVAFFGLSDPGRFRLDHSSNLSYEIVNDLRLGVEFYYNYDNRSFSESGPYDLGVLLTVRYEF